MEEEKKETIVANLPNGDYAPEKDQVLQEKLAKINALRAQGADMLVRLQSEKRLIKIDKDLSKEEKSKKLDLLNADKEKAKQVVGTNKEELKKATDETSAYIKATFEKVYSEAKSKDNKAKEELKTTFDKECHLLSQKRETAKTDNEETLKGYKEDDPMIADYRMESRKKAKQIDSEYGLEYQKAKNAYRRGINGLKQKEFRILKMRDRLLAQAKQGQYADLDKDTFKTKMQHAFTQEGIIELFLNNKAFFLALLIFIVSIIATGGLTVSAYNLNILMRQMSVFVIIAVGFAVMFSGGGFDLSIGEVTSLAGVTFGLIGMSTGNAFLGVLSAVAVSVLCLSINGTIIQTLGLPAFVLTLATDEVYKGITYLLTNGKTLNGWDSSLNWMGQGTIGGIPFIFIMAVIMMILVAVMMNKTIYGRHVLCVGGNIEAAKVSGISVKAIRISIFAICGVCIGIAGSLLTTRLGFASPDAGGSYLMDAIAAVVIGGTSMHGGKVKVVGTLFGVALIIFINNMLSLLNVSTYWQWISKGLIIIFALIMDQFSDKILARIRLRNQA